jgi:hypothetical protein
MMKSEDYPVDSKREMSFGRRGHAGLVRFIESENAVYNLGLGRTGYLKVGDGGFHHETLTVTKCQVL